jgi:hypothetical protein
MVFVHELRWDTKSTENLHRELAKIGMSTKDSPYNNEQSSVDGRNYDKGTNSVRPWALKHTSFDTQAITYGRTNELIKKKS